jgi:hypothetical protein
MPMVLVLWAGSMLLVNGGEFMCNWVMHVKWNVNHEEKTIEAIHSFKSSSFRIDCLDDSTCFLFFPSLS